jgi:hypothetical protein
MSEHDWIPSTYGHGETMCRHCGITNREAAAIGLLNHCKQTQTQIAPRPETVEVPARATCPHCGGPDGYFIDECHGIDRGEAWVSCDCRLRLSARPPTAETGVAQTARQLLDEAEQDGLILIDSWHAKECREEFLRRLEDAFATLRAQLAEAESRYDIADRSLTEVSAAIGTVEWMDPPDGGDVSLGEQVRRMRVALTEARVALAEKDKRIGEAERVRDMHWRRCNERGERITKAIEVLSTSLLSAAEKGSG